ncbi:MAG: type III PLP-dependent enzyme [Alphaproteobacteria bacterium]|nr:type III PLP-dependent enzyme [Alphaproteobacteria bacterium]
MTKVVSLKSHAAAARRRPAIDHGGGARLFGDSASVIAQLRPQRPLYILRTDKLTRTAQAFAAAFPGETMYAVKTNPHETAIRTLYKAGITSFDVASMDEVRLVRKYAPKAKMYFMHPVKAPEAIAESYHNYGIRHFVLDSLDELYKIIRETGLASDLHLYVRLALPKNHNAAIDFSAKFGATPAEAARLLRKCRSVAERLGLCFHVGTQTTEPSVYTRAVAHTASVIADSGVKIDMLDVGGGFPVPYPGEDAPSIQTCIATLQEALAAHGLSHLPLLAEPGRALVAESGTLVTRVELRKDKTLYINDGTYGGLFDAGPLLGTRYPVTAHRLSDKNGGKFKKPLADFRFVGPTCDGLDRMEGPFALPGDIKLGDYIEIGNMGAYSQGMRTNFNGFGAADLVVVTDT